MVYLRREKVSDPINKEMSISELSKHKEEARKAILVILRDLEEKTGLTISQVTLYKEMDRPFGRPRVVNCFITTSDIKI